MKPDTTFNPYAAPSTDIETAPFGRRAFPEMNRTEVKKLYHHSHTLITMSVLWSAGAIILVIAAISIFREKYFLSVFDLPPSTTAVIFIAQAGFNLLAVIGCWKRATWGRLVAIVACLTTMLSGAILPIIIAILVLVALFQGKRLFGPDRLRHADLKAEFKYRKKNRID